MLGYNKSLIKSDFNKAAKNYENLADLQKEIAIELINLFGKKITAQQKLLDLGAGIGALRKIINEHAIKPEIVELDIAIEMCRLANESGGSAICADAEALPFKFEIFDGVISSLCLQWASDLEKVFAAASKTIKQNGFMIFSTFAEETLKELRKTYENSDVAQRINEFFLTSEIVKQLKKAGFSQVKFYEERKLKYYGAPEDLLHNIKRIGAANKNKAARGQKLTKKIYSEILEKYKTNYSYGNEVYATWHVFYVMAEK